MWKSIILLILEDNGLKEYATSVVAVLTDATQLLTYKKEDAMTRHIILDGVKDHIVLHIAEEDTRKTMWDAVCKLYQDSSVNI